MLTGLLLFFSGCETFDSPRVERYPGVTVTDFTECNRANKNKTAAQTLAVIALDAVRNIH